MMLYGEQMPGFLESFKPVQKYPYLPDIARLELALVQSYQDADSTSVESGGLEAMPPEQLIKSVPILAPRVRSV